MSSLPAVLRPTLGSAGQAKPAANAPTFKVDPNWPQEMPNHWIMGAVTGVFVDAKQHVWVAHLPETLTEEELYEEQKPLPMGTCCKAAPPVLEFDPQGKLVQGWGQGSMTDFSDWPREPHGIFVDHQDNVWVGSFNRHRVMKFTRNGKLLLTLGQYEKTNGSADTTLLGGPSGIWVDPKTNEAFISDGYRNRRIIVFEGATGKYLRHWGAYGKVPDDTEKFDPKTMMSGALPKPVLDAARHHRIARRQDLRRRSPRQSHPGVRPAGQVPRGESGRARDAVVGIGVRARALARCAAAVALHG